MRGCGQVVEGVLGAGQRLHDPAITGHLRGRDHVPGLGVFESGQGGLELG